MEIMNKCISSDGFSFSSYVSRSYGRGLFISALGKSSCCLKMRAGWTATVSLLKSEKRALVANKRVHSRRHIMPSLLSFLLGICFIIYMSNSPYFHYRPKTSREITDMISPVRFQRTTFHESDLIVYPVNLVRSAPGLSSSFSNSLTAFFPSTFLTIFRIYQRCAGGTLLPACRNLTTPLW